MLKKLSIIVPCYNEEECLHETAKKLKEILNSLIEKKEVADTSRICFINDGSNDKTLDIIKKLAQNEAIFSYISLTRNFGHQSALLAGLFEEEADIYISIDADLQDDPFVIPQMVKQFKQGNHIVYGVRQSREKDTFFKKYSALFFYKLQGFLGLKVVYNSADFRLLSRKAVDMLKKFPERTLFLRGVVPLLGLKSTCVYYNRNERKYGETKYTLRKMCLLASNGILSFSLFPLHLITFLGITVAFIGLCFVLWALIQYIHHKTLVGWTSIFGAISFFSGIIIFSLGVIGEYIGKIFEEVKRRPLFMIDEKKS